MNFLSHHRVARTVAPLAPDAFFAGNILPDVAGARLKPTSTDEGPLADGVRLHLASDRAFHGDAAFLRLCGSAGDALREAGLSRPPRRVFFLAHVAVELALDAIFLREEPDLAADLLRRLPGARDATLAALAAWRPDLAGRDGAAWAERLDRFYREGFVARYADDAQLVSSLYHLALRVGEPLLPDGPDDRPALRDYFVRLRARVAPEAAGLAERAADAWYNSPTNRCV